MKTYYFILVMLASLEGTISIYFNGNGTDGSDSYGGEIRSIEDSTYMVVITLEEQEDSTYDTFHCAGALYKPDRVVTSAQCLLTRSGAKNLDTDRMKVYAGTSNLFNISEWREVAFVKPHEDYESNSGTHNIGVLKLKKPFDTSETIREAALSTIRHGPVPKPVEVEKTARSAGEKVDAAPPSCVIVGWGCGTLGGIPNSDLLYAKVSLYERDKCNQEYITKLKIDGISETTICVTSAVPKYNCLSDVGGPLICEGTIQGVYLYSDSCEQTSVTLPIAFTEVFSYADWLNTDPINSAAITIHSFKIIISAFLLQLFCVSFHLF